MRGRGSLWRGNTEDMARIEECVIYRDFQDGGLLARMNRLLETVSEKYFFAEEKEELCSICNELVELASMYGFHGNLWHNYVTWLLVNHENAFSIAAEIRGAVEGSLYELALRDFEILKELYDADLLLLDKKTGVSLFKILADYKGQDEGSRMISQRIRDRICSLSVELSEASDVKGFTESLLRFYKDFGVGKLGLHKAFRVEHDEKGKVQIVPIKRTAHVQLQDLVGYELAKKKLTDNTEAFVRGRKANNCLLFGDAGTGKSSSIKGILNQYYEEGLRIIELYKNQFADLNDVVAQIKNRNYRFIIYMDDLSFEEFETDYKYLKAVIEGGLEKKPDNVLIYATSNRRNLVRERAGDKLELSDEDDLHSSETVQEKLSLVYRFGVRIYFGKPDKKEFQNIVRVLAERNGIRMDEKKLFLLANQWELSNGGLTGRTAQQFIDYLLGTGTE